MSGDFCERYARLMHFLANGCAKLTRALIGKLVENAKPTDSEGANKPWTLADFLYDRQRQIPKIKNDAMYRKLFPGRHEETDVEEWDLSLLCFVVLHCAEDWMIKQDVKRLQSIRNKTCHTTNATIEKEQFDDFINVIEVIVDRCCKFIDKQEFTQEMQGFLAKCKKENIVGYINQDLKVVQEWYESDPVAELNRKVDRLSDDHQKMLDKLDEMMTLLETNGISGVTLPGTNVVLIVKNCSREKGAVISEYLVKLLTPKMSQDLPNLTGPDKDKVTDAVKEAMSELLKGDREIEEIYHACVNIRIRCSSFDSLRDLWISCIDGHMTKAFQDLQEHLRVFSECTELELDVRITHFEFNRCLEATVMEIAKSVNTFTGQEAAYDDSIDSIVGTNISTNVEVTRVTDGSVEATRSEDGSILVLNVQPASFNQAENIWKACRFGAFNEKLKGLSSVLKDVYGYEDLSISARLENDSPYDTVFQYKNTVEYGKETSPEQNDGTINTTRKMTEAMETLHERLPKYPTFDHFMSEIGNQLDSLPTISLENVRAMFVALNSEVFNETQNFTDLLGVLKKKGYIYPGNLTNLRRIVLKIEDRDSQDTMMKEVNEYSREQKAVYMSPPAEEHVHGYRRLQCQVKNANYYEYQTDKLETLVNRISTMIGADTGDILLDGIQYTGTIHITILIPDRQYEMFRAMVGLQGEVEMNVDLITFDDGTTIEVEHTISPLSSREELQHLKETTERIQSQIAAQENQLREFDKKFEELMSTTGSMARLEEPAKTIEASGFGVTNKTTRPGETASDDYKQLKDEIADLRDKLREGQERNPFLSLVRRGVTKQLEELFRTNGLKIDEDEGGFKVEVVRRAMKTSGELSDKEIAMIEKRVKAKDTELTQQVRENKSLVLLRLFYLENVDLPEIRDIDDFMETHLKEVGRMDLLKQWNKKKMESLREGLLSGLGELPVLGDFLKELTEKQSSLIPEIKKLLGRLNSKLTKEDIDELKKRTKKETSDEEVLELLVVEESGELQWRIDNLRTFLVDVFQSIGRADLIDWLQFEIHKSALKTEVKQVLRDISRKLSDAEKVKMRESLDNSQICEKDEELLEFFLWVERGNEDESTLDILRECMAKLFQELDNNTLFNELQTRLDTIGGFAEGVKMGVLREISLKLNDDDAAAVREKYQGVPEGLSKEEILPHIVKEKSRHQRWSVENLRNFIMDLLEDIGRKELMRYFDYAMHKAALKKPVKTILRRFSGELSHDEKNYVRGEIRNIIDIEEDDELLECYLWVKTKGEGESDSTLDVLLKCMKELFEAVGNEETLSMLFEELRKIDGDLKSEVRKTLQDTYTELSEEDKEKLRSKLTDPDPDMEDDDILCCLVQQESKNKSWSMDKLKMFLRDTLSSDGFKMFEEKNSENEFSFPGLTRLPGLANLMKQLGGLLGNQNNEIEQRLDALSDMCNALDAKIDQQQRGDTHVTYHIGLKSEVRQTLSNTCTVHIVSEDEKEISRSKLTEPDPDMEDDDILCRLVQQESRNKSWSMHNLETFLPSTPSGDGYEVFEEEFSENESSLPVQAGFREVVEHVKQLADQVGNLRNENKQGFEALTDMFNGLTQKIDQQPRITHNFLQTGKIRLICDVLNG